jgi:hypothetical protein
MVVGGKCRVGLLRWKHEEERRDLRLRYIFCRCRSVSVAKFKVRFAGRQEGARVARPSSRFERKGTPPSAQIHHNVINATDFEFRCLVLVETKVRKPVNTQPQAPFHVALSYPISRNAFDSSASPGCDPQPRQLFASPNTISAHESTLLHSHSATAKQIHDFTNVVNGQILLHTSCASNELKMGRRDHQPSQRE